MEKRKGWMRDSVPFLDSCLNETLRLTQHTIGSMRKVKSAGVYVRLRSGHHVCVPRGYYVGAAHALMGRREEEHLLSLINLIPMVTSSADAKISASRLSLCPSLQVCTRAQGHCRAAAH